VRRNTIRIAEPAPGRDLAEQVIGTSDAPTAGALALLARRDHVPEATAFLLEALPPRLNRMSAVDFLTLACGPVRNSRTAIYVGIISDINHLALVTLDIFDPATPAGRLGLCLLEQPPALWPELTREERAGLLLAIIYRIRAAA
jgi:hypothetical protein